MASQNTANNIAYDHNITVLLPSNDDYVKEKHLKMVNYMKLLADQLRAYGSTTKGSRLWATIYAYTKDKDAENNKLNAQPLDDDEWHHVAVLEWGWRSDIANTLHEVGCFLQNDKHL